TGALDAAAVHPLVAQLGPEDAPRRAGSGADPDRRTFLVVVDTRTVVQGPSRVDFVEELREIGAVESHGDDGGGVFRRTAPPPVAAMTAVGTGKAQLEPVSIDGAGLPIVRGQVAVRGFPAPRGRRPRHWRGPYHWRHWP